MGFVTCMKEHNVALDNSWIRPACERYGGGACGHVGSRMQITALFIRNSQIIFTELRIKAKRQIDENSIQPLLLEMMMNDENIEHLPE